MKRGYRKNIGLAITAAVLGGLMSATSVAARIVPATLQPLVGQGYKPIDDDERGLWQSCERLEQDLATSSLQVASPEFSAYTKTIMQRLLGDMAHDIRVFIMQDADFNASMSPNGMLIVNSGLLVRLHNEAEYAAVLGHEAGHYLRRHNLASWRDRRNKTAIIAFVSAGANLVAGSVVLAGGSASNGQSWINTANSINTGLVMSVFRFSREQESEADAYGLKLLDQAGYSPEAAQAMWQRLSDERRASASARGKRYRDSAMSAISTHPPAEARMLDLATSAREIEAVVVTGRAYRDGRAEWLAAVAPLRSGLLAEQVKLNDPGASLFLVRSLAADGWDGTLHFYEGESYRLRGEPGDDARAAEAYAASVASGNPPTEAWRAHGYALLKARRVDEGRAALAHYLVLQPQATDAAMVRFSLQQ